MVSHPTRSPSFPPEPASYPWAQSNVREELRHKIGSGCEHCQYWAVVDIDAAANFFHSDIKEVFNHFKWSYKTHNSF